MANWFKQLDMKQGDSQFNEPVTGGSMLQPSDKPVEVKITEVKLNDKNPFINVRIEDDNERYCFDSVPIQNYNNKEQPSFKLIMLFRALFGDKERSFKVRTALNDNENLIEAFVGLKVNAKIRAGRKGYTIDKAEDGGGFVIKDANPEGPLVDYLKKKLGDQTFESYQEAKQMVEVLNAEMGADDPYLRRAFPDVELYTKVSEEQCNDNFEAICAAIEATDAPSRVGGTTGGPKKSPSVAEIAAKARQSKQDSD